MATAKHLSDLSKLLGGEDQASGALKPPATWKQLKDPMTIEFNILPDGSEKQGVVNAFMRTLSPSIKVQSVERVQNLTMWQSYAVKRQSIITRESTGGQLGSRLRQRLLVWLLLLLPGCLRAAVANVDLRLTGDPAKDHRNEANLERVWLWHGTDEDTVAKIAQQGFNRTFAGKNATMYGKGTTLRSARTLLPTARPLPTHAGPLAFLTVSLLLCSFSSAPCMKLTRGVGSSALLPFNRRVLCARRLVLLVNAVLAPERQWSSAYVCVPRFCRCLLQRREGCAGARCAQRLSALRLHRERHGEPGDLCRLP